MLFTISRDVGETGETGITSGMFYQCKELGRTGGYIMIYVCLDGVVRQLGGPLNVERSPHFKLEITKHISCAWYGWDVSITSCHA